ncbi:MAG: hypothetical protein RBQ99_01790 [Trichlorobacter sp.]|nr:hypothetical protein [Trichlorobacter sp.]
MWTERRRKRWWQHFEDIERWASIGQHNEPTEELDDIAGQPRLSFLFTSEVLGLSAVAFGRIAESIGEESGGLLDGL